MVLFTSGSYEGAQREHIYSDEIDEGIVATEDDEGGEEVSSKRDNPDAQRESAAEQETPASSIFGDIGVFRDFFLAAFSDGYHNVRML